MSLLRSGMLLVFAATLQIGVLAYAVETPDDAPSIEPQLAKLLAADATSQTDKQLQNLLEFYESGGVIPEETLQSPHWRITSQLIAGMGGASSATTDPLMLAKFLEILVRNTPMNLSRDTKQFIEANPTEALTAAIRLSQKGFSHTARMAADVIMQYRDNLTATNWQAILDGRQYVVRHRESYPQGIYASAQGYSLIPMGYVFLRSSEARSLDSETKTFYNGEQAFPRGTHGLGWRADASHIGFGRLPAGNYTVQLKTTYTFKLGDMVVEGANASPEYEVEITAADTPDDLAAAVDDKLIAQVEASVQVGTREEAREVTYSRPLGDGKFQPTKKIVVPAIKITEPLPVTICVRPEIYVPGEEKPLRRTPWIVLAGNTNTRVLENWVGDARLSKLIAQAPGSEGKVPAKLVLRPSRAEALSDIAVKKYYPRTIERDIEIAWSKIPAGSK